MFNTTFLFTAGSDIAHCNSDSENIAETGIEAAIMLLVTSDVLIISLRSDLAAHEQLKRQALPRRRCQTCFKAIPLMLVYLVFVCAC